MTGPDDDLLYRSEVEWRMWHEDREIAALGGRGTALRPPGSKNWQTVQEGGLTLSCGHGLPDRWPHLNLPGLVMWCRLCEMGVVGGPQEAL